MVDGARERASVVVVALLTRSIVLIGVLIPAAERVPVMGPSYSPAIGFTRELEVDMPIAESLFFSLVVGHLIPGQPWIYPGIATCIGYLFPVRSVS